MAWQVWTGAACGLILVVSGFTMMGFGPLTGVLPSGGGRVFIGFLLVFGGSFATGVPFLMQGPERSD